MQVLALKSNPFKRITDIKQELILSQFKIENEQINHLKVKFGIRVLFSVILYNLLKKLSSKFNGVQLGLNSQNLRKIHNIFVTLRGI